MKDRSASEADRLRVELIHVRGGDSRIDIKMKPAKETQIKHIRDSEPDRLFMCLDHLQDGDMLVISGSVPASLSPICMSGS